MNTEEGKTVFAKVKAIQPIIEGMLKNAERESEHFKAFREVKTFIELVDEQLKDIETLIVKLDSKFTNIDS